MRYVHKSSDTVKNSLITNTFFNNGSLAMGLDALREIDISNGPLLRDYRRRTVT